MIRIDLSNVSAERLGVTHGLELEREFRAWAPRLEQAVAGLWERRSRPEEMLGWLDSPYDRHGPEAISEYARALLNGGADSPTDLVVLGIGGSSLGAMTVVSALQHPYRGIQESGSGLRVHFVDNVDPDAIAGLMEVLDPRRTLVNVISKSGTTAETMAAYLAFRQWLEQAVAESSADWIVATTDPQSGILRPLADRRGYRTFTVPPSVGGRFSVLSAVGLLPVALAGLDIHALLEGAARANETARLPLAENPILQATLAQFLAYRRGKPISVLMPYSSRLRNLGGWFVQLWAESLGKAESRSGSRVHEGSTPLAALGATDQHSQVQLFNEGPNNKLVAFVRLERFDVETAIPDAEPGLDELDYLAGQSFNRLINAEQAATAFALAQNDRPNYTLALPELNAASLGELLQFLMWQTAVMGELTDIDTYDQPGVELGKTYTYALMGRDGFDEARALLRRNGVEPEER
ncbi:MAG: glucose-6-phosphate isomerase [Trueperaceae bacterium]